jgi:6-phosphogluconolactonase/glucosamine-6-phosphate isomerase/deaminase
MMGDERVSREPEINNYLQLVKRFPDHEVTENTLETIPLDTETEKDFAFRVENYFLQELTELTNPKIISILGVGIDGHTAGIFPMEEKLFRQVYQDDVMYAPVALKGLTIDSRASVTPTWLLDHADVLLGYICGEAKKEILIDLNTNDKKLHERPAEILKLHRRAYVYTDQDITPRE